jgi:hypothetical protein
VRAQLALGMFMCSACANQEAMSKMQVPDWDGPAVTVRDTADGGLRIAMQVTTGGHALRLEEVTRDGSAAMLHLRQQMPTGDLVPQVMTELVVQVSAEDLLSASTVWVWMRRDGEPEQLAAKVTRPGLRAP